MGNLLPELRGVYKFPVHCAGLPSLQVLGIPYNHCAKFFCSFGIVVIGVV